MKDTGGNTKSKIVTAGWRLFYEKGYEETTIEDIVAESHTSKASFYHYFSGKDAILSSLSLLFDEKYDELKPELTEEMTASEQLLFLNTELFRMIENTVSIELLSQLLSSQLVTSGEKHLLDHSRTYFKLLRQIISKGMQNGEFDKSYTVNEIVKAYALFERAIMYDWCLCDGEYSLASYGKNMLTKLLDGYKPG